MNDTSVSAPLPTGFAGLTGHDLARERFTTVGEIYEEAKKRLDPVVWDFLDGGAGEETTVASNRLSFNRWNLIPQLLSGIESVSTDTMFLGEALAFPLMTSPFAADRLFHDDGHLAVARANAAFGTASIVPEASSFSLERIAREAPTAARIFQLHPVGPVENFRRIAGRARDAGYRALCLTIDCPVGGWRERNKRNRFSTDRSVTAGNYENGEYFRTFMRPDQPIWSWDTVEREMVGIGLPFMTKGVLTAQDARRAVEAGASAILISNHGGRQLDGAPAALEQLPEIVEEVGGEAEIAIDSGIRRGSDIVKALALGADIVVIGRAAAMALTAGGEGGISCLLALLRSEVENIMRITGRPDIASLDRTLVRRTSVHV